MTIKKITIKLIVAYLLLLVTFLFHVNAETARFDVIRDVWVSSYPDEENFNMGATSRLKLKGIQEMVLMDFDLSSLSGKKIESARLYLCDVNKYNKLRKIGISTVASPWIEGKSKRNSIDKFGKGATFLYSSYNQRRWAGDGSDLTDVTMGNGNTRQHHTELEREEGMWWSVVIDPILIQAVIADKSYGLFIMDESGQTFANNYVFSKESRHSSPYLVITFSETQKRPPKKLKVELSPSDENAHMEFGAVIMKIFIDESILAYDIFINEVEVPHWRVPKPASTDSMQEIVLDWLPPDKKIKVNILAVDELGQRSEPALVSGYSSSSLPKSHFPAYEDAIHVDKEEREPSFSKSPLIWVVPEISKVDPISGDVFSEVHSEGLSNRNSIWSAKEKKIALIGIKGEVIGFQVVVEIEDLLLDELQFKVSSLTGNNGKMIMNDRFAFYQVHYVEKNHHWYPELAIPMRDGNINMKVTSIPVKDQKNQLIYVDLSIPSEIETGIYHGKISILNKSKTIESFQIQLNVADIMMPGKLTFVPELNMYKGPGKAGTDRFFQAHRIAHEHRTVINRVPYGQNGKFHEDMIPIMSSLRNGQFKIDWSDYDRRLGPLFDGTAFTTGERRGIPVEKFYLPLFENWPTELASNYQYENVQRKTRETITKHALDAQPLDNALTSEYKERFAAVVKEFIEHFEEKGWNRTEVQFYLNNKWKWENASSWWDLDEPMSYDDWMALRFFGSLFQSAKGTTSLNFVYRADISRPRWQHDWLHGILQRMYVQNKSFFRYSNRVRQMKKDGQINFSIYGSLNDIESSNNQTVLWCMMAFVEGADGVLPWQSLGGHKAFSIPDNNALIVDAREELGIDWVVSLRLKALRRGQQNVELLALLEDKYGYKREQIRDFFYRFFGSAKVLPEYNTNDKLSEIFTEIDSHKMEIFRRTLIKYIGSSTTY